MYWWFGSDRPNTSTNSQGGRGDFLARYVTRRSLRAAPWRRSAFASAPSSRRWWRRKRKRRSAAANAISATPAPKGYRNGHRERRLVGPFGAVTVSLPRARLFDEGGREKEWKSQTIEAYKRLTKRAEAIIAYFKFFPLHVVLKRSDNRARRMS